MDNYYKEFSEIRQDMSAEEIRQELSRQNAVLGNRFDAKSLETQEQIKAALEVFRDEESKRAYDQALAGSEAPKTDPAQERRTKQEELLQRAQDFYKKKEYDLAKTAMDRALEQDKDLPTSIAYFLAACIYNRTDEYGCALQYINEALLLEPEHIQFNLQKGLIYDCKAQKLTKDNRFLSSPELQAEYQELRAKGLAQMRNTCEQAHSKNDQLFALETLAWAEYTWANLIDEAQAEKDRQAGIQHLREAEKLGPLSSLSQKILEEFDARCERRKQNAPRLKKLMESANNYLEWRKYDHARADIEEALKLDVEPNGILYGQAADIYCWCGDCDAASRCLDKALTLEPKHPFIIAVMGHFCGMKAWELAEDDQFSSTSHLRSEYQTLRKQELALLKGALEDVRKWADSHQSEDGLEDGLSAALNPAIYREDEGLLYTAVLERLAWAEYFRPDRIDPVQAKADQCSGLERALFFQKNYYGNFDSAPIQDIVLDYQALTKRARNFYENGEFAQAKVWIEKALRFGETGLPACPTLYKDAAQIYLKNRAIDSALWYIDQERNRDPKNIYHLRETGEFCGREALDLAKHSQFRFSSMLQEFYQKVRAKELEVSQAACKAARLDKNALEIAYALGYLAWVEYLRPNQLDMAQAERDKRAGVEDANEAERMCPGHSKHAAEVLKRYHEQLEEWTKQARSHWDKHEYVQGKNVIVKVLNAKGNTGGSYLYWLAARIYIGTNELDTALRYIDIALSKDPKGVYSLITKGEIYRKKAEQIYKNSSFQSSSELQNNWRALVTEELEMMEKAVDAAKESGDKQKQADALGHLAWTFYFSIEAEQNRACQLARQALELSKNWQAQEVLKSAEEAERERRVAQEWQAELKRMRREKSIWHRLFW